MTFNERRFKVSRYLFQWSHFCVIYVAHVFNILIKTDFSGETNGAVYNLNGPSRPRPAPWCA